MSSGKDVEGLLTQMDDEDEVPGARGGENDLEVRPSVYGKPGDAGVEDGRADRGTALHRALEGRICHEIPHLTAKEVRSLVSITERLIVAYQPERIYLFGSKARGDYGPDSDFDLMVVVPDDAQEDRKQSRLAYERLWDTGTAADVLVWTRERFESRSYLRASLPGTILREGRLVYAA